jgi:hypothetical protein
MKLPDPVRAEFRRQGRRGGRTRARRLSALERKRIARLAAVRRWIRVRFGEPRFEALGLPGGVRVDRGLDDLAAGRETLESFAVSLAAPPGWRGRPGPSTLGPLPRKPGLLRPVAHGRHSARRTSGWACAGVAGSRGAYLSCGAGCSVPSARISRYWS